MRKSFPYILAIFMILAVLVVGALGALYMVPNTFEDDGTSKVLVIDQNATGAEIADMLFEQGLIRSPLGFRMWLALSGTSDKLQSGHYQIPSKVTVRELIDLLQEGHVESIRLTIPEGYTVGDIAIALERAKIMPAAEFLAEAKRFTPYPYMKGTRPTTYPVEGFLFPSTYEVPVNATAQDVIIMMSEEMNRYLTPAVKKQIQAQHMSIHDFVTLASLVEREALFDADRPIIAGVLKRRLAHGIPLQSDATISYVLGYAKENVTISDTQLQSPYNTYVVKGLPPGPISNPGKKALDAVLYSENTEYLYFVADKEGHNHFSKTYAEHLAAVERIYGESQGTTPDASSQVTAQAGPNYDVAATSEPNYNYSSQEAIEADSQYVEVEPSYSYAPNYTSSAAPTAPARVSESVSIPITQAAPEVAEPTPAPAQPIETEVPTATQPIYIPIPTPAGASTDGTTGSN
ncbi:endolytic transglycosylase MltG [Veillonella agrestimuris]|uniref:endolytic transglycosylase MltG n=1 Tax=Veillonella agrestimuris TaxID=2941340 RepID=UPI00203EE47D|nr:endolytic transglycosylase MltG [Veillonella agrestimuris]